MKILAVSDQVVDWIYSAQICVKFNDIDVVIDCGDLPKEYLEFIISSLDAPAFFVHGNHAPAGNVELPGESNLGGAINLHCKVVSIKGITFAGIEGSLEYNRGRYQYSQAGMWLNVFRLIPSLLHNRVQYGRFLNVFVSHAPAWKLHDQPDLPHQGIKAFRWLLEVFQPDYHIHGHVHVYRPDTPTETRFGRTKVINAYGYKQIEI